jgi:glycerol-3-phosphate dehydrogenase subunit C
MMATRKLLSLIPGLKFDVVESSCCGMAGSFGLEAEHSGAAIVMAEVSLRSAVHSTAEATPRPRVSCRHQIAHGSGRSSIHIAVLLRDALAHG